MAALRWADVDLSDGEDVVVTRRHSTTNAGGERPDGHARRQLEDCPLMCPRKLGAPQNIIRFAGRPHASVQAMNAAPFEAWRTAVGAGAGGRDHRGSPSAADQW